MGHGKARNLQSASSTVFVLIAVLPLLVFTSTLYSLNTIHETRAQAGLALSLLISLLGFYVFRTMMAQTSEFIRGLVKAAVQRADPVHPFVMAAPMAERKELRTPGIGAIQELGDMAQTMAALWKREAEPHLGRQVALSVVRSTEPLVGTLKKVTDDGVLLEREGREVAVSYHRLAAIEAG